MFLENTEKRIKMIKKIILSGVILAGVFALFVPFSGQSVVAISNDEICSLSPSGCVSEIDESDENPIADWILKLAKILLGITTAVSVLYIILGAWFIITGIGGDGPTYTKGLQILKNAVLGLVVALLAWTIVGFIGGALEGQNNIISDIFNSN